MEQDLYPSQVILISITPELTCDEGKGEKKERLIHLLHESSQAAP